MSASIKLLRAGRGSLRDIDNDLWTFFSLNALECLFKSGVMGVPFKKSGR